MVLYPASLAPDSKEKREGREEGLTMDRPYSEATLLQYSYEETFYSTNER